MSPSHRRLEQSASDHPSCVRYRVSALSNVGLLFGVVPFIRGTQASSAVLHPFAFFEGAGGGYVLHGAAIGFGLAIPADIDALTRIGAARSAARFTSAGRVYPVDRETLEYSLLDAKASASRDRSPFRSGQLFVLAQGGLGMQTIEDQERTHLTESDKHIADGERHIVDQEALIERLRADGQDVTTFESVLATFRKTLANHHAHRATILQRIAMLKREAVPHPAAVQRTGTRTGPS